MTYKLGIDLGGTSVKYGVVDQNNQLIAHHSFPTEAGRAFEAIVEDIAKHTEIALAKVNLSLDDLDHIGMGVPSSVNPHTKRIVFANNLNWRNVDIISEYNKHIDKKVYIANDADCAVYGEYLAGAAQNSDNALMLTLGTGVGSGMIIDGQIYLGGNGFGCEFGHSILKMGGELCTCGRRGCVEAYASVTALIRDSQRAIEANPDSLMLKLIDHDLSKLEGRTAFDAAALNDPSAIEVVNQYIDYLAEALASFINALRPKSVILGGGVSNQQDKLLNPLIERLNELVYGVEYIGLPNIVIAQLQNDAGIIGAANLGKGLNKNE